MLWGLLGDKSKTYTKYTTNNTNSTVFVLPVSVEVVICVIFVSSRLLVLRYVGAALLITFVF